MYHATQQPQQYNNTVTTTTGYFSTTATGYSSASDTDTSYDDHHHTSTSHFISHHQYLPSSSQYASDSEHSEHSSRSFSSEDPNNYASRSSPSSADDPSPTDSSNLTDFPALFCRAKYDYTAQDASALSFVTGDIIEVLTQQPSGWWDGLLGEERGWFPSNYVIVISEEEAEREWEGREIMQAGDNQMQMQMTGGQGQSHRHTQSTSSVVDMGQALMGGSSSSTDEWLANTIAESRSMGIDDDQGLGGPSRGRGRGGAESDFWMPQVASNGQIFYINTKTGEQSRDLPQEAEDDIDLSMTDDAPLALAQSSSSSRAGPGVLGYATSSGPYTDLDPSSAPYASGSSNSQFQSQPGFGLPRRTDTPEPWIRRLADDGLSYYYLNQVDGRVQWTRPESLTSRGSGLPETPTTAVPLPLHGRARSDSVNNLTGGGHAPVNSDPLEVGVVCASDKVRFRKRQLDERSVRKVLDKLDRLNEDELHINLNLTSNNDLALMLLKLNLNPTLLSLGKKRLTAAFKPTNLGLGMPGSGRAGSWTGFGFVAGNDVDENEDQDIEREVAKRKKVNEHWKKSNGIGGSNDTNTGQSFLPNSRF
ncbi:ras GEF [Lentinula edodes]|uniref:Ras GEF n=1 Tax=Lentinula edodes TaxID=5353 RepID=A0A1Q3E7B4_LENED|nr:ras GEF [Lentinula edodes]